VNVLSFSLYGAAPIYCEGAVRNAELAPRVYPGWVVRVYVDRSVPAAVLARLRALGCDVVVFEGPSRGPQHGKFWRFTVAADPNVERFACRDADSRLNPREKAAVDAWIASGAPFHVMRDSIHHRKRILGGMWGGIGGAIPDIQERIDGWPDFAEWGDSDRFLCERVWPLVADRCLVHDSWGHFDGIKPFPPHAPLDGTSYVGEIVPVDRAGFDVWREVGVLQDRAVCLQAEIAHRDAEIANRDAEIAHRDAEIARLRRPMWRRVLARVERRS
jgi:hypothetical protein